MQLITNAPIWVWPLLVALIVLGLRASRDRVTSPLPIYLVPLIGLISVKSVFVLLVPGIIALCATYALGGLIGLKLQSKFIKHKDGGRIALRGEWLTLACVLIIFTLNYANGALLSIAPEIMQGPLPLALFLGIAFPSGIFLGRALRVWHFMRAA